MQTPLADQSKVLAIEGSLIPHPLSYGRDGRGRLFVGSDGLVRVVEERAIEETRRFIADPEIRRLVGEGRLIGAEEIGSAAGALFLSHPKLPFVTFPFEWTAEMLKDAGRVSLDVAEGAARAGFVPLDLHPWNVVFHDTSPGFVDYGAFAAFVNEATGQRRSFHPGDCFVNSFVRALELMSEGYGALVRAFFLKRVPLNARNLPALSSRAVLKHFVALSLRKHIPSRLYRSLSVPYRRIKPRAKPAHADSLLRCIDGLRTRLERIRVAPGASSRNGGRPWDGREAAERAAVLEAAVADLSFRDVVDLDGSYGFPGLFFARKGFHLVAIGAYEGDISELYSTARAESLPVTPVLMSLTSPSPQPAHPHGHLVSVQERLAGDLLLATSCIRELALEKRVDFVSLAELFTVYTKRYLVTEFVAPDDPAVSQRTRLVPPWYGENQFLEDFSRRFRIVKRVPSDPPTRCLFVMERLP